MVLLGRLAELAACQDALSPGGNGAAGVLLTGPAGIGKTSLWRAVATSQADGAVVLRTTGIPAGQRGFVNLADLLDPVTQTVVPRLPEPQAGALRAALGLTVAETPIRETLIERAVVTVIRDLAAGGLVVAVDDEQWVDDDTRELIQTAAVRLGDAPVRWLVAVRSGHADEGLAKVLEHELGARMRRLDLAGLDDASLSDLVGDRFPGQWSPGVLRRVVSLAAGSPYAALEIARETIAGGGRDGAAIQLPSTLSGALRRRLERLGPRTLRVVQVAALATSPTRALLRAVEGGPVSEQVDEALEANVLEAVAPDPVLQFSHPLLREAVESMLTGPARRRLHRLIGAALGEQEEAVWHLACGADEPDEALAERVEEAAENVRTRGALVRASALAQMAVALTPDPDGTSAWRRRIIRLERLAEAGEFDQVRRLGEKWALDIPVTLRGRLSVVRGSNALDLESASTLLAAGFAELAGIDPARAAGAGTQLSVISGIVLRRLGEGRRQAAAAVVQARMAGDPVVLRNALGADGYLAAIAGESNAGEKLREAVRLPGLDDTPYFYDSPETELGIWSLWRGELDQARDLLATVIAAAERHGSEASINGILIHLVEVEWRAGHWDTAAAHAAVHARWMRETGHGQGGTAAYVVSLMEASRGNVDDARALAGAGVEHAEEQQDWAFAAQCRWVLGQLELSVDDPAAAVHWLEPIAEMLQAGQIGEPGCYPFTPDLIEAWAAVGDLERAGRRLAWLQDAASRLDHPWARITSSRAEAVLRLAQRDPATAVQSVAAVILEARERGLPLELGRCLLVLGTAQRRSRQRRDAAVSLRDAAAIFGSLGATRWQALAEAQLARLTPEPERTLTPTERRIADLVAAGRSNPEVAAALFVSVKTVEANLTRIYRKLGLRGRVDLARRNAG